MMKVLLRRTKTKCSRMGGEERGQVGPSLHIVLIVFSQLRVTGPDTRLGPQCHRPCHQLDDF